MNENYKEKTRKHLTWEDVYYDGITYEELDYDKSFDPKFEWFDETTQELSDIGINDGWDSYDFETEEEYDEYIEEKYEGVKFKHYK